MAGAGAEEKLVQNAVLLGQYHDNKNLGKVEILLSNLLLSLRRLQKHPPKQRRFAQTLCNISSCLFSVPLRGRGDSFYKQIRNCANSVLFMWVVYNWGGIFSSLGNSEEDKRATTNVQNGLVFIFILFFSLFVSLLNSKKNPGGKTLKNSENFRV